MSRINDVGGLEGFGRIEPVRDEPPFHADWEAHVFAVDQALLQRGVYTVDEFRDALERIPPGDYLGASYYERWLLTIHRLLVDKGVVDARELPSLG